MTISIRSILLTCSVVFVATGCATSFRGEAHIDGPGPCRSKCKEWGMDLSGMVAMGEYSDACICRVRGKDDAADETGAVGAGAVGVVMQMRADEQARRQAMMMR